MFDLRRIPMLRVLVPFFGGVYTGFQLNAKFELFPVLILLAILIPMLFVLFKGQWQKPAVLSCFLALLLFLSIYLTGVGTGMDARPSDPCLPEEKLVVVRGELIGSLETGVNGYEFDLEVHLLYSADSTYRTGTLLKCYLPLPADSLLPAPGESWQYSGRLKGIQKARNPGMPDYRAIFGRKNCWYRFYVSSRSLCGPFNRELIEDCKKLDPSQIRYQISEHWQGEEEEISLLKAVCLGDRSSLGDDLRQTYQDAGGMHLLAVSGLHVGLIWWVLQYLTGWLNLVFRKGFKQTFLVVALLWFYAFLTGFSSSVCRSVTMFSFFSVSRMRGEHSQPLNVIFASAFLLVMIDPSRMMDVGFQLSYAAITGIVVLYPLSMRMLRPKHRVLRWIWQASSVSLAAQLATAPLVVYYFQQIPLYSLISSIIAIPMLSVLIAIFVCSVPFVSAGILEDLFSFLLVIPARFMNRSMDLLSSIPGAVLGELHLDPLGLFVWLLALLLAMLALHGRSRLPLYLILLLISFSLNWNSYSRLKCFSSSELVIAHFRGASQLSLRAGEKVDHYCWYRDSTSMEYIKTYRTQVWSKSIYRNSLHEGFAIGKESGCASSCIELKKGLWLIGNDGISGLVLRGGEIESPLNLGDSTLGLAMRLDFVLLSGEVPMEELQSWQSFEEVTLVIDGSTHSWYKDRLSTAWDHIYLTDQRGAYVKRW